MQDYKKDLNERNIQPLSDDYIKFIRYGQYYIEKNGEGVLAFITNNSFVDGLVHRQMRKNLLETFDKIYILDLHGNSRKQETTPDGSKDENVFDIMAGVSINIFIKTLKHKENQLAEVYHHDVQGKRKSKYDFLDNHLFNNIDWNILEVKEPNYFFIDKDLTGQNEYSEGFEIDKLFVVNNNGIETGKDTFFYEISKSELEVNLKSAFLDKTDAINKYNMTNTTSFQFKDKFNMAEIDYSKIRLISYRPFDVIHSYYDESLQRRPAFSTMKQMFNENIGLLTPRQFAGDFKHVFVSKHPTDCNLTGTAKKFGSAPLFPLYLYPEPEEDAQTELLKSTDTPKRVPNLDPDITAEIANTIGLTFTDEKTNKAGTFAPIDILDYIYAVLHSPTYRETYKEFLKIDFPRVPYPSDAETFWQLVALGGELRHIHLLESPKLSEQRKALGLAYPQQGDNSVTRKMTKTSAGFELNDSSDTIGKVWINDKQYFDNVPLIAWEFYIGGYQPAQKWLKDRRERTLDHNDIKHYMNIIAALSLTSDIMQRIDSIEVV